MSHDTTEHGKDLEEQALGTARDGLPRSHSFLKNNPLMSAGIAFAAGALLSMLIRR